MDLCNVNLLIKLLYSVNEYNVFCYIKLRKVL